LINNITNKRQPLTIMVQNQLQDMLMKGELIVGEYLPSENTLCQQFGVSRTTIRDAISALVEKGFLERRQGKGVLIIDESDSVAVDSIRILMLRNKYSINELLETRKVIEGSIAYLAAQRATPEQIKIMENCIKAMVNKGQNIDKYSIYDSEFHTELALAAQNRLLLAVVTAIKPLLVHLIKSVVKSGGQMERNMRFHTRILDAIKAGNPEEAEKRMYEHLEASEKIMLRSIEEGYCVDQIMEYREM